MGSDDIHKKQKRKKQGRRQQIKELDPGKYLIVCEGEKTEPNYFRYFEKIMNKGCSKKLKNICVEGKGMNTESLVKKAEEINAQAIIQYQNIWCVFDKDSFKAQQFNSAIILAENKGMQCAWSNEAIELWFLLHFENLVTGITRHQYIEKLNSIFKKKNIGNGEYKKNLENIYEILKKYGNQRLAISYAKQLDYSGETPANRKPATTVYKLVEELEKIIEKDFS